MTEEKKTWVNPLDSVPQFRNDIANHLIYGALLGYVIMYVMFGCKEHHLIEAHRIQWWAFIGVLAVSTLKKIVDFFKEGESVAVCIEKSLLTAVPQLLFCVLNSMAAHYV